MKTCALIPAYNEASHIGQVVSGARAHVDSVVVIDDGSTDETAELARRAGAVCLRNAANRGKGSVLRTGMKHAISEGFTHAVTLDGDGQHLPGRYFRAAARRPGNRSRPGDWRAQLRTFAMPSGALLLEHGGQPLGVGAWWAGKSPTAKADSECTNWREFRQIVLRSTRYEFEMEALIKMARAGRSLSMPPSK